MGTPDEHRTRDEHTTSDERFTHGTATVDGVDLHYVECAPTPPVDAPLVVLLHGFPECWYSWRHQLPALADAGYHAVAPDMRGYGESARPTGTASYRIDRLTDDVAGLVATFDADAAHVVGHDWGALVAWELAVRRPAVVRSLTALSVPHPGGIECALRSPAQLRRSWYVGFFQLPRLPEAVLRAGDFRVVESAFRRSPGYPEAITDADVERYKAALAAPGSLSAAVNYYRAYVREKAGEAVRNALSGRGFYSDVALDGRVVAPALVVRGERDPFVGPAAFGGLDRWVPDCRLVALAGTGHWLQQERPAAVTDLLVEFIDGVAQP